MEVLDGVIDPRRGQGSKYNLQTRITPPIRSWASSGASFLGGEGVVTMLAIVRMTLLYDCQKLSFFFLLNITHVIYIKISCRFEKNVTPVCIARQGPALYSREDTPPEPLYMYLQSDWLCNYLGIGANCPQTSGRSPNRELCPYVPKGVLICPQR